MDGPNTTTVIMIIDDNPNDQDIYQRYIKRDKNTRYSFILAETGREGLERYKSDHIDCILLDYNLPDVDGLEFLKQISASESLLRAPIIFLTGQGDETIAVEAMKRGASDYLIKDKVDSEVLIRSIKYSISARANNRAEQEHLIFLETLIDTIPNPVFFKNRGGVFKGCNKAFERFVQKPREEIIGRTDTSLLPKDFAETCRGIDERLLKKASIESFEETLHMPNDKNRYILVNKASYTNISGEVEGLVGVIQDITERKKAEEEVKRLALYDDLTSLPNRRLFFERLSQALSRARRNGTFVTVLYIDLNGFKPINDTYGHEAGDEVLHLIGKSVSDSIRKMDTGARIGGDEFAVILPDLPRTDGIERVGEKIGRAIHEPITILDKQVSVTASVGVSIFPEDSENINEIVNNADEAMYIAKHRRRETDDYNIAFYSSRQREIHE